MDEPETAASRTGPVLAIFAHPDDAEICAGGTLAAWAAAGREVHLLVLTNGDRGSSDPDLSRAQLASIRLAETEAAGEILGLAGVRVLSTHDGELENTPEIREAVVRRIREVRAETVVSCDPTAVFFESTTGTTTTATYYNHSDHRMAGWVALDSAFPGSGNPHFYSEHLGEGLGVQDVHEVWLGWSNDANRTVDISGHMQTKVDALAAHASQLTEGIRFFEEFLTKDAAEAGAKIGVDHAEEFRLLDLS
jgi:LmbE family N-acetylglucosaminyl deacetylase